MTTVSHRTVACSVLVDVFHHPFLEGDATPVTADEHLAHRRMTGMATETCLACPMFAACLENAVVDHDVNGFVAGTTARQRSRIRSLLKVHVEAEDLDALVGVMGHGSRVRTTDVLRARREHPDQPLGFIAERLGCSLSTVKRHLRRARCQSDRPRAASCRPTIDQLLQAFRAVTGRTARPVRMAA